MKKEKKTYEDFFASYVAKFAEGGRSNKRNPERIADVFWCEIENFPVEKFIQEDNFDSISSDCIRDIASFIGRVENALNNNEGPDKDDEICTNITEFIDRLREYILFLMKNSTSPGILLADFHLINIEDKSFTGEAENYCQKLQALFYAIKDKIIKDRKGYIKRIQRIKEKQRLNLLAAMILRKYSTMPQKSAASP